jgi:hypothetical protein
MKVIGLGFLPSSRLSDHGNMFTKGRRGEAEHPLLAGHHPSARAASPRLTVVTQNTRNPTVTKRKIVLQLGAQELSKCTPCNFIYRMDFCVIYRTPVGVDSALISLKTNLIVDICMNLGFMDLKII